MVLLENGYWRLTSIENPSNCGEYVLAKRRTHRCGDHFLEHDFEQQIAANKPGFEIIAEIKELRTRFATLESQNKELEKKLEAFPQKNLDVRQRAIIT